MKKIYIPIIVIGSVIVTFGSQLAVIRVGGKGRFAEMPVIGDAFKVVKESEEVVEIDNERFKEVDQMIETLKGQIAEYEALQEESMQTNERLKREIGKQQSKITDLNDKMANILLVVETRQKEAIKTTARKYEKTNPKVVAGILKETREARECAEILLFMNDRQAAKVIEAYAAMGNDETARKDNAKRIAEIMKLMQKIVVADDEGV
ncbi:unnamed protein product [marine sediment metagenome]|uniref:Magnesium transporter MgtE intracellular domain-containing protein n=1 Tax=marine sediment metagenome TaxID=412755 RepID=X1HWC9_9ZZZZ